MVTEEKKTNVDDIFQKFSSSREGLTGAEAASRLEKSGPNAIEEKKENLILKMLKYFWGPIPWMIEIAALLSLIIHHWADFSLIMALLVFNAFVAFWQEYQAGNAIEALKKKLAIQSRVLRDGHWKVIGARELVPGDVIRVKLGDIIPADGVLFDGEYLIVDQSVLTGESLPVSKVVGDIVYSGSIAQKGEMLALVTATGKDTYFGETAKLVASSKTVSHFQKAVLQIGDFLIYVCLALVSILIVVQLSREASILELLKFSLILTVASIPVAMPAVLSVTMAVGALALSKMKAIVTRLESIEEMAGVDTLCCDKTGTLTCNKLTMGSPMLFRCKSNDELILAASLASHEEDSDPIDQAIIEGLSDPAQLKEYVQLNFIPFDPVIKRTEATIQAVKNRTFKVTKGAPQIILGLCEKDAAFEKQVNDAIEAFAQKGYRTLGVASVEKNGKWQFLGLIPLYDQVRSDSKETVEQAQEHGLEVKMLTGDHLSIAREVAREVGIGQAILNANELVAENKTKKLSDVADLVEKADGFSQVFPESKHLVVRSLQAKNHIVGMTGDGVNDAPALKQADLGIAVSGATDAARSAASLVLTAPGLSVIISAIEEARRIFERMNTYAIYRITETIRIMFFMVLAMLIYNFYPITAFMLILLALLNDIPIMSIAYDHAPLPPKPVRWDMHRVIITACVLGGIGIIETFLLLVIADSWFHVKLAELQSIIFLKLSLAGHMTLFIARARSVFWLKPYPAPILLGSILLTQLFAALIVGFGVFMTAIPWAYIGYIWLYCIVWMFIEDGAKILVYRHFDHTAKHHKDFMATAKNPISDYHVGRSQK